MSRYSARRPQRCKKKKKRKKEKEKEKKKEKKKGRKRREEEEGGGLHGASWRLAHASVSRNVHLLRLVMAWLCAKRPLKDIRTRAAKAKNVCVILAGSRRF